MVIRSTLCVIGIFLLLFSYSAAQNYPGVALNFNWGHEYYDDIVTDALLLDDGGLVMVGYRSFPDDYYYTDLVESFIVRFNGGGITVDSAIAISSSTRINSIQQIAGNKFLVSGTVGAPNFSYWMAVLDSNLNVTWEKLFGDPFGNFEDYLKNNDCSALQLNNGDLLFAGQTYQPNNQCDILLMRFTESGDLIWKDTLGGSGYEYFRQITELPDLSILLLSYTDSNDGDVSGNHGYADVWIVHLSSAGALLSQKCLGGSKDDDPSRLILLPDNAIMIAASTRSDDGDITVNYGSKDVWLVKTDWAGNILSQHSYGSTFDGPSNSYFANSEEPFDITGYANGDCLIASKSNSMDPVLGNHGYYYTYDTWLMMVDAAGDIKWQRDYGGNDDEQPGKILVINDSTFYVLNYSQSEFSGDVQQDCYDYNYNEFTGDAWIMKLTYENIPCAVNAGFGYSHKCVDFNFFNTSYFADYYQWDFGDGTTSAEVSPAHSYTQNGSYTICLTAGSSCSSKTFCQTITTYNPSFYAGFSYNQDYQNSKKFQFFGYNWLPPVTYNWDFGDGTADTGQYPIHEYANNGIYPVTMIITEGICGASDTAVQDMNTCGWTFPENFAAEELNCLEWNFYGTNPFYPANHTYFWDFDDGTTSTIGTDFHHFPNGGTYNVCLTITDSCSGPVTACHLIQVDDTIISAFGYELDYSDPYVIHFFNYSQYAESQWWDFGDGYTYTSSELNPDHHYSQLGSYNVCLHLTNDCSTADTCMMILLTGMEEVADKQLEVEIFPNPFHETISIVMNLPVASDAEIHLFDMAGRKIHPEFLPQHEGDATSLVINLESLTSGVYLVRVKSSKGVAVRKLIKQ